MKRKSKYSKGTREYALLMLKHNSLKEGCSLNSSPTLKNEMRCPGIERRPVNTGDIVKRSFSNG
jgi:hypothetical protein